MKKFIKEYPEVWALPFLLIVWIVVRPVVLQWLGNANIVLPDDTLQSLLFSAITLMAGSLFAMLGIRMNFPRLYKWYKESQIENNSSQGSSSSSAWPFYVLYVTLVLGFILGVIAIM